MNIRNRIIDYRTVKASELAPHPNNWRKHPKAQQDAIRGILAEVGFVDALMVRLLPGGKYQIVDGHLRAETAPDMDIPVLVVDLDDAEAAKVLATFDPIGAMAEADKENLDAILKGVETQSDALREMLEGLAKDAGCEWAKGSGGEVVEDEVPEPPAEPVTKPGDLWLLGEHRLLCGDSTKGESWERLSIGANSICFTSPPYNLGDSIKLSGNKTRSADENAYTDHDDNIADYGQFIREIQKQALTHCEAAIFNVQPVAGCKAALLRWIGESADNICDVVTWDKGHAAPAMAEGVLSSRYEWLVILSRKSPASRRVPLSSWRGTMQSVYCGPPQRHNEYAEIHGATFPVHLPAWVIGDLCNRAACVIDCCCGTGTTLIAAQQLGRRCYGMEISPAYCDVIVKRWENLTGEKARLA